MTLQMKQCKLKRILPSIFCHIHRKKTPPPPLWIGPTVVPGPVGGGPCPPVCAPSIDEKKLHAALNDVTRKLDDLRIGQERLQSLDERLRTTAAEETRKRTELERKLRAVLEAVEPAGFSINDRLNAMRATEEKRSRPFYQEHS